MCLSVCGSVVLSLARPPALALALTHFCLPQESASLRAKGTLGPTENRTSTVGALALCIVFECACVSKRAHESAHMFAFFQDVEMALRAGTSMFKLFEPSRVASSGYKTAFFYETPVNCREIEGGFGSGRSVAMIGR
eukprot:830667-Rhodomonas_salina.3